MLLLATGKHRMDLASSHGLHNSITQPTRITAKRKSCLDPLLTTSDLVPVSTCVIETHCGDQCMMTGEFDVSLPGPSA